MAQKTNLAKQNTARILETGIPRGAIAKNGSPSQDTAMVEIGIPILKQETGKLETTGIQTQKITRIPNKVILKQETARMLEICIQRRDPAKIGIPRWDTATPIPKKDTAR